MPDATSAFKQQLNDAFAEICVGQRYIYRRTFTEGDVALFCGVTGDFNPYHMDEALPAIPALAGVSYPAC